MARSGTLVTHDDGRECVLQPDGGWSIVTNQRGWIGRPVGKCSRNHGMSLDVPELETEDLHAGCQGAYDYEKRRADFAEARITAIRAALHQLANKMDGIGGYVTHEVLGGKTIAGAVRQVIYENEQVRRRD